MNGFHKSDEVDVSSLEWGWIFFPQAHFARKMRDFGQLQPDYWLDDKFELKFSK